MTACGLDKLAQLSKGALFDVTCADEKPDPFDLIELTGFPHEQQPEPRPDKIPGVAHVNNCGRRMPVLKILQTSHCQFNCRYCAFRKDCDTPRESLAPDELAATVTTMVRGGIVEGLFLSSGIGPDVCETMTQMIDTARILREKHLFGGYIHLKILPGAPIDLIEAAGQVADRLSINMEAPSETALKEISPNKSIKANILKRMQWIETLRRSGKIPRRVGQVTQFVVGGSDDPGENDRALVVASDYLYRELDFRRVYYSTFKPVIGTPLEGRPPENPLRSHRLYQADFLLKQYGFRPDELVFSEAGRLDLETDPKEKWASAHPELFPMEITSVDPSQLLRIPGIGPVTSRRILQARVEGRMQSSDDLLALGRIPRKALKWVVINGKPGEHSAPIVQGWDSPQLKLDQF